VAEFPALPLFTDAYLADTRHLTTEEHGAYLLLLMCAWRTRGCALKDDDLLLSRIAGVSKARWRRLRPSLSDFFLVHNGQWQQKKLSHIYETVSKKVERNRMNGAKGGHAKALKKKAVSLDDNVLKNQPFRQAQARFLPGWQKLQCHEKQRDNAHAERITTKTKTKSNLGSSNGLVDTSFAATPEKDVFARIAAAAAIHKGHLDKTVVKHWFEAGASLLADIVPTIERIREREKRRQGQVPQHLAYYSAAILEAQHKRAGAITMGQEGVAHVPELPERKAFCHMHSQDWRAFLGDAKSRFRGEYLSRNWCIPESHPLFLAADLGPDPCHRVNPAIPLDVYEEYAQNWGWRPRGESSSLTTDIKEKKETT